MIFTASISIVILNWNGGNEVLDCLEYVINQTYSSVQLLVVDNGSTDQSLQAIRQNYPEIAIIENDRNLGYAEGMNIGIGHATGEYVVLLNQDAFLKKDYLEEALQVFREDEQIGMVAGSVYSMVESFESQQAPQNCGIMMRWQMRPIGNKACLDGVTVFGPSFACAMIRRKALEDVRCVFNDYFDEDYFAYQEDIDLCFRLALRGWRTVYSSKLALQHRHGSATAGQVSMIAKPLWLQRHILKNRYLTSLKDIPTALMWKVVPALIMGDAIRLLYFLLFSPRTLIAWVGAIKDTAQLLPKTLTRRKYIQRRRIADNQTISRLFISI